MKSIESILTSRSSVTVSKTIFYRKKYINLKVKWGLLTYLLLLLMKRYELMRASLVAQLVKNLPAMQNTLVWLVYYLVSCWLDTKCSFKIPTIYHYKECIKSKLFKSVKDSESIRLITTLENIPSIFKIYKTWSLIFSQLNNHPKSLNNFPKNGFSSAQLCLTLCDPLDCSMPGFPVDRQLPGFTQTHVHWVSEAIQPSQPLLFPSPLACNLSQHQGLFKQVSSSHQVAKVLEFQLQHQSFQWIFRTDFL